MQSPCAQQVASKAQSVIGTSEEEQEDIVAASADADQRNWRLVAVGVLAPIVAVIVIIAAVTG